MLLLPRAEIQSLVHKLRSHKPHSLAKKKKKNLTSKLYKCVGNRKKSKAKRKQTKNQKRITVQINEIKNKKAIEKINKIKISTLKIKLHV